MNCARIAVAFVLACTARIAVAQDEPRVIQHVEVINEPGRFAGWPANNGIWNWGDEIVVGFTFGYHKDKSGHTIDPNRPSGSQQARSRDGGLTWTIESPAWADEGKSAAAQELTQPIDFTAADFAARFRGDRFYYSLDRCGEWNGPFKLPTFGRPGLLARTDYLVEGKHRLTAFVAAEKEQGREGQPACIRTIDGGQSWRLVGWIGQQPPPGGYGYAIMPATVALEGGSYLSMIRRGGVFDGRRRWWLEAYLSPDDGRSWYLLDQPQIDNAGNPATLTRLADGRLALAYGWRTAPYGIRARISDDEGQNWSDEFVLQAGGANWDLGYPRTVQRSDGKLVTVYYFNDARAKERYIAATIWDAGSRQSANQAGQAEAD